jgi:hypothetical protein
MRITKGYSVFRPQTGQAKGNVSSGSVGTSPSAIYLDTTGPLSGKISAVGRGAFLPMMYYVPDILP